MHKHSRIIILLIYLLVPVIAHAELPSDLIMEEAVIEKVNKESGTYYLQIENELYQVAPDARVDFCRQKKPLEELLQMEGDQVTLHINKDNLIDKISFLCM